jgi:hypothetical protein
MPYPDRATFHCNIQIVRPVVFGLPRVIHFLVVQMWEFGKNLINNRIVFLQRTKHVFLLNEIKTDSLVPVEFTNFGEDGFVQFRAKDFQAKENKPNSKMRIIFSDLFVDLVESIHEHFLVVLLYFISFKVVLLEFAQEGTEFDSVVAILDIF